MSLRVVITGGHHTGTLPVIGELRKRGVKDLYWFGHKFSIEGDKNPTLEFREITALGIPFFNLKAGKFYKTRDVIRLLKIPLGVVHALILLLRIKPDVILSFGGYIAAPTVVAGWLLGIPSVTHEQTAVTGYANNVISKFAKKILVTWEESKDYFPADKVVVSGLPLREEIFESQTNRLKLNPNLPTIYITAGKTGSNTINRVVGKALPQLLSFANVLHQCGDTSFSNDYEMLVRKHSEVSNAAGEYNLRKFVMADEIGEFFSKADLIVGRSGAHTVCEILALEKPALLIPIPWVSHNEQHRNAEVIKSRGLGEILKQVDLNEDSLATEIRKMLQNLPKYKLEDNSLKFRHKDAATIIVNETLAVAKRKTDIQ